MSNINDAAGGAVIEVAPETEVLVDTVPAAAGIGDLQKQFEDLQRNYANREAQFLQSQQENESLRVQVENSNKAGRTQLIATAKATMDTLKKELIDAQETGDYTKAADLSEKIGRLGARLEMLENAEAVEKTAPTTPPSQFRNPDEYIAIHTPPSQAWLRSHLDYVTDPKKNLLLIAADAKARAEAHTPDSPAYFAFVEKELGISTAQAALSAQPTPPPAPPQQQKAPPIAAPVSHNPPNSQGQQPKTRVVLTPAEVQMAKDLSIPLEEYARNKMLAAAEGKLGNTQQQ